MSADVVEAPPGMRIPVLVLSTSPLLRSRAEAEAGAWANAVEAPMTTPLLSTSPLLRSRAAEVETEAGAGVDAVDVPPGMTISVLSTSPVLR
jgi:hypothetical protein